MITIQNTSEKYGEGKQSYVLNAPKIKSKDAVTIGFLHEYSTGLAECLRSAANAVDRHNRVNSFTNKPSSYPGRLEIYRDAREEYRWRMLAHNGKIIATSGEGYLTKRGIKKSLEAMFKRSYVEVQV